MKGAGARAVLDALHAHGVTLIFTCPGSTEAAILDSSLEYESPRLILTTHESIAIAAADGYARATGVPAVAYLHANVGLANGIAHLHCAQLAGSPVVILNGLKSTIIANRGGFTTAPYPAEYVRQHVKSDRVALRSEALAEEIGRALRLATTAPTGPVYVGLPQNLVEADVAIAQPPTQPPVAPSRPGASAIDAAAALFLGAAGMTIVAGSEIARAGAGDLLMELAARLDAVVLLEDRRTIADSGVAASGERFGGFYFTKKPAVAEAGAIFFAGMPALMEFEPPREALAPPVPIVHMSADASAIGRVVPATVGLAGDPSETLRALLAAVPPETASAERTAFRHRCVEEYAARAAEITAEARTRTGAVPIAVDALMVALADALPADCIVVGDPVTSGADLLHRTIANSRRAYHTTSGGSLGWGMGAAIGFALAEPAKRIVCVIGDGVFQFGIQALATAAQLALPITFLVVNNAAYAAVRAAVKRYRGTPAGPFPASDLAGVDIAAIAHGFGAAAFTIKRLSELAEALAAAGAHQGPSVIDIHTDPDHTGPA